MGYIPSWSPGIWGRTPVAPCNEHPVECDGAERLRHVTTRDNDTTSECYTSATPGHSRRQPTTLVTTLVTHRVTSRDNIRDTLTPQEDATFVVTKQSMTTSFTITRWFRNLFSTMTLASLTLSFKHLENWKGGFEWRAEEEL